MFGALKKRLKEALQKASSIVKEDKKGEKEEPVFEAEPAQKIEKEPEEIKPELFEEKQAAEELLKIEEKAEETKKEEPVIREETERKETEERIKEATSEAAKTRESPVVISKKQPVHALAEEKIAPETQQETIVTQEKPLEHVKEEKKSIFGRLTKKVTEKKLSDEDVERILEELKTALLENDVAVDVTEKLSDEMKHSLIGKSARRGEVERAIKDSLKAAMLDVLKQDSIDIETLVEGKNGKPLVVLFFGFNGVGKTTTIAKVASKYKKYRPVIAAGDTFRAASIEQLEEHAKKLGVEVVKHTYGSDSAAVIFDAIKHAEAAGSRLVLADTAGRSHSNANLIDELKKVVRVNKPDLKILVLDSITGNDIVDQSKLFDDAAGVDAVILTKADVYEKGGSALSASYTIKKPILFLGTGQGYEDLREFNPEEIVRNLLE